MQFFHQISNGKFPLGREIFYRRAALSFSSHIPFKFEYVMRSIERTWIVGVNILHGYFTSFQVSLQSVHANE
jgi:hypothetical protein